MVASNIANIDLSDTGFKSIGSKETPFRGHFDGNYANFELNINDAGDYLGLFGHTSIESSINRLSVSGDVYGGDYIGGIGYLRVRVKFTTEQILRVEITLVAL